MKRSRRKLSDTVIHRDIFKSNQITLFPCFNFTSETRGYVLLYVISVFYVKLESLGINEQ